MNNVEQIFADIRAKYKRTKRNYIILNITAFFLSAGLVILNLFAIRFNPAHDDAVAHKTTESMVIIGVFVSLAILSAISGFVTSIISLFVFRKKTKQANSKIASIKVEVKMHKSHEGPYADKDRDKLLIEKITKIKNQA